MDRIPENPAERRAFDYGVETYGGDALSWMAIMTSNWATIERQQHPGGSFGEQLAIMSNQLKNAAIERRKAISALEMIAGVRPCIDGLMGNADIAAAALADSSSPPNEGGKS